MLVSHLTFKINFKQMKTIITNSGKEVKIFSDSVESPVLSQITDLAEFPAYKDAIIRIMPDCHVGVGCTIGTTMTIKDKITPNLVGVDIGCGMLTVKLKESKINLEKLDKVINEKVPSGRSIHKKQQVDFDFSQLKRKYELNIERAKKSIGSLGGGNHFIEIGKGGKGELFLVIHSGSRGIGNDVASLYQKTAIKNINTKNEIGGIIEKLKAENRFSEIQQVIQDAKSNIISAKDKNLAYLEKNFFDDYMHDMKIMQEYASLNRRVMANIILDNAGLTEEYSFETIHNYIDFERMILRKGAVSAEKDEKLLIPINMRDGSLICIGKGNEDWNYSAPHGAGRLMSRTQAKKSIMLSSFQKQMQGIYSSSVGKNTIDEAPDAYKPMAEIIDLITDTVDIIDIIKPIYNFKAH